MADGHGMNGHAQRAQGGWRVMAALRSAGHRLRGEGISADTVSIERVWHGETVSFSVRNLGAAPVRMDEILLFQGSHTLCGHTRVHAEGFTMLSQTVGTLRQPRPVTQYTDRDHYRLPEPAGWLTAYSLLYLSPRDQDPILLGFTSCHRFQGAIRFSDTRFEVVLDTEGRTLAPGTSWKLEEFAVLCGANRHELFERFARLIARNHPRSESGIARPPRGWSSWVSHGLEVTAEKLRKTVAIRRRSGRTGELVLLDDGYQTRMGDWFCTTERFGATVAEVASEILSAGFEPGLWVAPFVADEDSRLFTDNPDWFVTDERSRPMRSDRLGFGGWGTNGRWYALDGTHPDVRLFLRSLFRTLRGYGFRYFKLDALYWGCLRGVHFHDAAATRVEAYRRGMAAIREGAGDDAFLIGANHPVWPNLGLIEASRTSMDIFPTWESVRSTSLENRLRCWQNGLLWHVDPDSVLLGNAPGLHAFEGRLSDAELSFHQASVFACGGLVQSGDNQEFLSGKALARLSCFPRAARTYFHDGQLTVATVSSAAGDYLVVLNPDDAEKTFALPDMPSNDTMNVILGDARLHARGSIRFAQLAARSGAVLEIDAI